MTIDAGQDSTKQHPNVRAAIRFPRAFLAIGLLCAVVACRPALIPHERLLLERATRVTNVRGWQKARPTGVEYQWISEHTIFSARSEQTLIYDTSLQTEKPLTRLNEQIDRYVPGGIWRWKLSPDGKWLLWTKRTVGSEPEDMRVARLDGSQFQIVHIPLPNTVITSFTWEIDSRHWDAGLYRNHYSDYSDEFMRGDLEAPEKPATVSHYPPYDLFIREIAETHDTHRRLLLRHEVPGAPYSGTKLTHDPTANMTGDVQIIEVEQSHGGDKLAWLFLSTRPLTELSISNRDGSGMHEVGHLPLANTAGVGECLDSLRWLPSDKKVSFHFKDAIWTIPAE